MSNNPSSANTTRRCAAITRSGNPCKNFAQADSRYCRIHKEDATTINSSHSKDQNAEIDLSLQRQLLEELERLNKRLESVKLDGKFVLYPNDDISKERDYKKIASEIIQEIIERIQNLIGEDILDIDTWKGLWYMINYSIEYQADLVRRRVSGEYETDDWGLDWEFLNTIRPLFEFMYSKYWRIETTGIENIPDDGKGLLVSNHSGQLPWDAAMIGIAVLMEHPSERLVRSLYGTWFPKLPFISDILVKTGQVLATEENGTRLLKQGELVAVFPEGYKGIGKLYKDRYRLARFGRGGFIKMALKSKAPIIPVSVVGAEETYIALSQVPIFEKITGFPFFPISPTWPWLGPLGFVPLPTKWYIDFGEVISFEDYEEGSENNLVLVSQLTNQVRNIVQEMVFSRLSSRKSVFYG
jgi:1-acyl-sn-glycerol-3-phosphate acyltransferase